MTSTAERRRIGLIVPSSNVTVETEMAQLLRRVDGVDFSLHSSRMRMHQVTPEQLRAMNAQRERCVDEIADAGVDAILYACLVAIMVGGPGEHRRIEHEIDAQLHDGASGISILSSAGALVRALTDLGARRISLVMPYTRAVAETVVGYLDAEGFVIVGWRALGVADNTEVGCIPSSRVMQAARELDLTDSDALVISCCVQMPSLDIVQTAEDEFGLPVLSAATAGAYEILRTLNLTIDIPGAGSLLRAGTAATVR